MFGQYGHHDFRELLDALDEPFLIFVEQFPSLLVEGIAFALGLHEPDQRADEIGSYRLVVSERGLEPFKQPVEGVHGILAVLGSGFPYGLHFPEDVVAVMVAVDEAEVLQLAFVGIVEFAVGVVDDIADAVAVFPLRIERNTLDFDELDVPDADGVVLAVNLDVREEVFSPPVINLTFEVIHDFLGERVEVRHFVHGDGETYVELLAAGAHVGRDFPDYVSLADVPIVEAVGERGCAGKRIDFLVALEFLDYFEQFPVGRVDFIVVGTAGERERGEKFDLVLYHGKTHMVKYSFCYINIAWSSRYP